MIKTMILLISFLMIGCSGDNSLLDVIDQSKSNDVDQEPKVGAFTVVREFYMLDNSHYKAKVIQHKKSKKCFIFNGTEDHIRKNSFFYPIDCDFNS